jgi:nucleotide-binding universal stress UspA family protein
MNAIKKILVPTDFSAHADEAFRVAHTLAQATGAQLIVFHVAKPPAVVVEGGRFLDHPDNDEATNLWDCFQNLKPVDPRVRVEHQVIVDEKPNAGHILEMLDKMGCDLIVIGAHGHSWLKHLIFGSLAEEVVRRARCPVMVVKAPVPAPGPSILEPAQAASV